MAKYVFLALVFIASNASAIPVIWTTDAIFDDGGTLSGNFVFDADIDPNTTAGVLSVDFTTTPGISGSFPGNRYTQVSSIVTSTFQNSTDRLGFLLEIFSDDATRLLTINIQNPVTPVLTNAGGRFIAVPTDWDERLADRTGPRRLERGLLTGVPAVAVPEPSVLALLALGLLGLGLKRRR